MTQALCMLYMFVCTFQSIRSLVHNQSKHGTLAHHRMTELCSSQCWCALVRSYFRVIAPHTGVALFVRAVVWVVVEVPPQCWRGQ